MNDLRKVTVCSTCHMASCWHGEFYCGSAKVSGSIDLTVAYLRKLDREHPDNWSAMKMAEVYGDQSPQHIRALAAETEP